VASGDGRPPYYYHEATRVTRWEVPDDEAMADAISATIERGRVVVGHAATKRTSQLERLELLRAQAALVVDAWAEGRKLGALLDDLAAVLGDKAPRFKGFNPLDSGDVKKAYMRVARGLHPDKVVRAHLAPDEAVVCALVFEALAPKYEAFKKEREKEHRAERREAAGL